MALREAGVPFVALRPGAFLDQAEDFNAANTLKNKFMGVSDRTQTRWTYAPHGRSRRLTGLRG